MAEDRPLQPALQAIPERHKSDIELADFDESYSAGNSQAPLAEDRTSSSTDALEPERGNWTGRFDFLLSLLGYSVGLGNVWRFPYLCYNNGGGAFLIPFSIMLVIAGLPLMFMELSFGQYASLGPVAIYSRFCPLLHGLGYGMVIVSTIVMLYYNLIIAWTIFYMTASLTSELPWQNCDHDWSTKHCFSYEKADQCDAINGTFYQRHCYNQSHPDFYNLSKLAEEAIRRPPAEEYFTNHVLGLSSGIEEIGKIKISMALCLLAAWIIVFLCLCKGVKSSGKVVYFTALFPYVVLVMLFVRGVTLPGAKTGILFYLTPDWTQLGNAQVWGDAAVQIFFALSPAWGGLITLSSYNRYNNNCYKDALIVAVSNIATSFFAGLVIFSVIGFLAHELDVDVEKVVDQGAGLAFIVYPEVVTRLPISPVWSLLFFVMLLTLGLDSQFALMETVTTAILDKFPNLRGRKIWVVLFVAVFGYFGGLIFTTNSGMYWLQLMDKYAANWSVLIIAITECIIISWFYGAERFCSDIQDMIGPQSRCWVVFWSCMWKYVTPYALLFILFFNWVEYKPASYGNYVYPLWADAVGWVIGILPLMVIIIIALYKVFFTCAPGVSFKQLRDSINDLSASVISESANGGRKPGPSILKTSQNNRMARNGIGNEDPASEPLLASETTPENTQNGGPDAQKLLYFTTEKKNKSNGVTYPVPLLNRDSSNATVANLIVLSNGDTTATIYTSPIIKINERDNTKPHQSVATPIISALENRTSTVTLTKTVIPVVPKSSIIDLEAKVAKNIKGNNPLTIVINPAAVGMSKPVSDKTKTGVLTTAGNTVSTQQIVSILNKNDVTKTPGVLVNSATTAISKHNTTNSATLQETSVIVVNNVTSEAMAANKSKGASSVTHNVSKISSTIIAPHTSKLQDIVTTNASSSPGFTKSYGISCVTINKDAPKASSQATNKSLVASSMAPASDTVRPLSVVQNKSGIALLNEGSKSPASVVTPAKSVTTTTIDASKSSAAKSAPKIVSGFTDKPAVTSTFSGVSQQSATAVGAPETSAKITATMPNKPQRITEIASSKSMISGNSIPLTKATAIEKPKVKSNITLSNEGSKASSVSLTKKSLVTSSAISVTPKTLGSAFSKQQIKDGVNTTSDISKASPDKPGNPTGSTNKSINFNPVTPKASDALNIADPTNTPQVTSQFNKYMISSTSNVSSESPGTEIATVPVANTGALKNDSQSQCAKEAASKKIHVGNKESIEMSNVPKPSGLGKMSGTKDDCVNPQIKDKDTRDLNVSKSVKLKADKDNNLVNESPSRVTQDVKSTDSGVKVKK